MESVLWELGWLKNALSYKPANHASVPPQFKHTKIKQSSAADQFVTLFLFIFNMQIRFLFCTIEIKYTNRIDAKSKQCEYSWISPQPLATVRWIPARLYAHKKQCKQSAAYWITKKWSSEQLCTSFAEQQYVPWSCNGS